MMKLRPGEKPILPVWFRAGLVLALVVTVGSTFAFRIDSKALPPAEDHGSVANQVMLHFVDQDNGVVSIVNADTQTEITRLHTGEDGFMRSVMRGMVRTRKAQNIGPEVPFQLTLWSDGLVSLIDPVTHRRVELSAFGTDNVRAFTRLLPAVPVSRLAGV